MQFIEAIKPENNSPEALDNKLIGGLTEDRKLFLERDVDENIIALVRNIMKFNMQDMGKPVEERRPIWLYIMSYGGNSDCMWMMIDAMRASRTPIYTVNLGVAASAASLIFMTGVQRFMMRNANVLIHEGSASMSGDAVKVMDMSDSYKRMVAKMKNYILEHTTIPKALLMKKRSNDWEIDADTCLEYHICTKVVDSFEEIIDTPVTVNCHTGALTQANDEGIMKKVC